MTSEEKNEHNNMEFQKLSRAERDLFKQRENRLDNEFDILLRKDITLAILAHGNGASDKNNPWIRALRIFNFIKYGGDPDAPGAPKYQGWD